MMSLFSFKKLCAGVFVLALVLMGTQAFAANYPLEIIQPKAGLTTKNRFYKAYPGIEYNVRAAVLGGAYPFSFRLTTAPEGMTINSTTGEIKWPSPPASSTPYQVGVAVTDQEGSTSSVQWTITVTTAGFRFIDSVNGKTRAGGGTGAINNPWKTIADMYEGSDYASKRASSYAGEFLYFRAGTYAMDGYIEDGSRMALVENTKPLVWMAYPGEAPVFDMGRGHLAIYSGADNAYFSGITFTNMSNSDKAGVRLESNGNNVTFWKNIFRDLPAMSGSYNQGAIMITKGNVGYNWSFLDNKFSNIRHGYGILGYWAQKVLVENNSFTDFSDPLGEDSSHAIGPKDQTNMWFIRANTLTNISGDGIWVGMYNGTVTKDVEISYNLVKNTSGDGLDVNHAYSPSPGKVYLVRNTFVGGNVIFKNVNSSTGPFYATSNIIINNSTGADHITCAGCSDASKLIRSNNLSGTSADNIVDANGNLTAAYGSYLYTRGFQTVSTASASAPPSPPKNLRVAN